MLQLNRGNWGKMKYVHVYLFEEVDWDFFGNSEDWKSQFVQLGARNF